MVKGKNSEKVFAPTDTAKLSILRDEINILAKLCLRRAHEAEAWAKEELDPERGVQRTRVLLYRNIAYILHVLLRSDVADLMERG